MRKYSWILALLAALAMIFVGCGGGGNDPDPGGEVREMKEVFDLQAYFTENEIEVGATRAQIFGEERFMCGADSDGVEMTYAIIEEEDVLKLKFTTGQSWAGIDLKHQGMQFYTGDELYIKGYAVTATDIYLNTNNNGERPLDGWKPALAADEEFEETFTLTAADVGYIEANAWVPGIRIRTGAAKTIVIEQITVKGLRIVGYVPCECCDDSGTCLDAEECDGECCCDLCLGSCAGCFIPTVIPGYGDYQVPTGAPTGSFYLDLNEASLIQVSGGGLNAPETTPDVSIEADKVIVTFDKIHHRVGFDLPEVKAAEVRNAFAGAAFGGSVSVTVKGTASATGNTRSAFGDPTATSNWNASANLPGLAYPAGEFELTISSGWGDMANSINAKIYDAFFLQARNASGGAAASDEIEFTLEIASILVTVVAPTPAVVSKLDIEISIPEDEATADTTIETDQYTGTIAWNPALAAGKFEPNKDYVATITLTAKQFYTFNTLTASSFTVEGALSTTFNTATSVITATFATTTVIQDFPNDTTIVIAASGTGVVGDELTATYTAGTDGPATVDYHWQIKVGSNWVNIADAEDATFETEEPGEYRVLIHSLGYHSLESNTVQIKCGDCDELVCECEIEVWSHFKSGFTGVTFTGGTSNPTEYFGNNYGPQRQGGGSSWEIDGSDLVFTAGGNYQGIIIQVGSAAGGTLHYANATNGFIAEVGKTYKITINASVDEGTGTLRIKANNDDGKASSKSLTTTPTDFDFTWTQVSTPVSAGGLGNTNLVLDNAGTSGGFIIHSILIEQVGKY
ncbi:MAG: hypothetical protein FWB86_13945 [Treponema sp.]|nr:hypothetical protein [Treponema sp.]